MAASNSVENPSQLAFFMLKRLLDVVGCCKITRFTAAHIERCCVRGMGSRTDFSHISEMFDDKKMRSRLYPIFHIALLNDFGSFTFCMSDRLLESVYCSTDSPSLSVVVYFQSVLWLLKPPITMWGLFLCANAWSRNGLYGGLYCTTPGSSTIMNSIFSSSQTEMFHTFRPSLIKTEFPCLLCEGSATSAIPGILGIA